MVAVMIPMILIVARVLTEPLLTSKVNILDE